MKDQQDEFLTSRPAIGCKEGLTLRELFHASLVGINGVLDVLEDVPAVLR